MIADVILTSMPLLSPKWLRLHDFYLHRITGRKAVPPRWQICIKSAATLSTAFSALYVRKYFDQKSKHKVIIIYLKQIFFSHLKIYSDLKVEEMVQFIHKEFIKMLNRVDWMEDRTRKQALEKARTITTHIGFPQQLLNDYEIAKVYQNVSQTELRPTVFSYFQTHDKKDNSEYVFDFSIDLWLTLDYRRKNSILVFVFVFLCCL